MGRRSSSVGTTNLSLTSPPPQPDVISMLQMHPHPMLVDHIVETILNYVSTTNLSQLLSLRTVCSLWNAYCTKLLQDKYYLSFGGHKYNVGRLKSFLDEFDLNNKDENQNICEISHTRITFPILRFRLFSDLFQECNKSTVLKFISKFGPIAESLVIFKDINSDIEYTEEELSNFKFPKLKHLIFSDRRRSGFSQDANAQSFLFQLVSSSRSTLTTLNIKFPREPIYEIFEKEELIIKVFEKCYMSRLRVLKLDMNITDKVLKSLTLVNLRLKTLHLSLGASQFSSESLKTLLNSLRGSLEDLRLTDLYRRASLVVDLPELTNLKHFEIHGLELPAYFVTFPDFSYATKMPNLKKLKLNTWAPIKAWEVFVPEVGKDKEELEPLRNSVRGVTALSLAMNFDCPVIMRRVTSMFLRVKVLEMHFSRSAVAALQVVFQNMNQLEELTLNQSYLGEISTNCIDDVLTGLEVEECKWMLKKKAYKVGDLSGMGKKPNLSDLKNLKKFDMMSLRHRNTVTDVCGYLLFMKMPHLRTLDIGRTQLSDACLRDLAVRFPHGKFEKYYLTKKTKGYSYGYDSSYYRNSTFTSICAVQ